MIGTRRMLEVDFKRSLRKNVLSAKIRFYRALISRIKSYVYV